MLETNKISIRPIEKQDTENILKWRNSKHVKDNFCVEHDITKEEHENWLKNQIDTQKTYQFVIYDKELKQDVGSVFIKNIDQQDKNGEFGIFIGLKEALGRGIGKDAMSLILNFAKETLKLHKVYLRVLEKNDRAIHLYQKIGFQIEGKLIDHVYKKEEGYLNLILMGVILDE